MLRWIFQKLTYQEAEARDGKQQGKTNKCWMEGMKRRAFGLQWLGDELQRLASSMGS